MYYSFLENEFGFTKTVETINGNAFYDVEFVNKKRIISVSYGNIEDHLEVILFMLEKGKMPKTMTIKQKRYI